MLAGVIVTQVVILIGMLLQRRAVNGTYRAVNGVDEKNGEPRLIDQVRIQGREIQNLKAMNVWKVGVLTKVAEQVGVRVPPLPPEIPHDDEERAA